MPLTSGPGSIRSNMQELMGNKVQDPKRERAIRTIMKKNNITYEEAKYRQAYRISQKQARK